jgi:hypothetical protein
MILKQTVRTKMLDLYRNINEFKKGFQPKTNVARDESGDPLTDSRSVLNKWKNNFRQLFNVHGVNDVTQTEMHTAEPFIPEPSSLKVEIARYCSNFWHNRYKPEEISHILISTDLLILNNFCRILTMVCYIERIVLLDFIHRLVSQEQTKLRN